MRSSTALGRALLAASTIGIFAGIFTAREAQGADANALQAHTHDAGRASQTERTDGGRRADEQGLSMAGRCSLSLVSIRSCSSQLGTAPYTPVCLGRPTPRDTQGGQFQTALDRSNW